MILCFSLGGGWGRIFFFRVLYLLLAVGLLAVHGPSLVVLSEDYSLAGCSGFTLVVLLLGPWASTVVAQGLNCPAMCGIFLEQALNRCPLHCKADSYLLHPGKPRYFACLLCFLATPGHAGS